MIEIKLHKIFSEKFKSIQKSVKTHADVACDTFGQSANKYPVLDAFCDSIHKWKSYLDDLRITRVSKLMKTIIPCSEDQLEFKDPSGYDGFIRINKDLALKIMTLGYIPNNGECE
jgi:hypothetical protein